MKNKTLEERFDAEYLRTLNLPHQKFTGFYKKGVEALDECQNL